MNRTDATVKLCEQALGEPMVVKTVSGRLAVYTRPAPFKETPNEDAVAIFPVGQEAVVLVVADGMGGARCGERASAAVLDAIHDVVSVDHDDDRWLHSEILNGLERANESVQSIGQGAGSTLAAAEIHCRRIRTYHVGDSMALLVGQRGKVKMQTICHSPVGFAVEAGVLDETEAMHHEDRHVISNYVGLTGMSIEVGSPVTMSSRDTLLLATDGLFDNLHVEEIVERIRIGSIEDAARALVEDCTTRMAEQEKSLPSKPDDLSFVLYRPDVIA
jgi:serine/threonine protein phosphatase PrpC